MVKNKAKIAPESFYNPRASRALKRALDPGRKGLRARDVCFAHMRVRFFIFKCWQVCFLQFIAAHGQPDVHAWATHVHFSQYLAPETPLIPTKSVPECPVLETPIFTLELVPKPPIFDFEVAHTYHDWVECPPPPRSFSLCAKFIH